MPTKRRMAAEDPPRDRLVEHVLVSVSSREAERQFRHVEGRRELPQLITALEVLVNKNSLETSEQVA